MAMIQPKIQLSKKQNEFIREAKEVWNFKIGAVRSGKSYEDVAYEIINGIFERRGLAGLNVIMGVSKSTVERNVLQPMREIYTSALVTTINSQNIAYICGEPVYCIGAEKQSQVAKIQGSSIKYCYGDEVAKWHQDVFHMLESRLDKPYSRFAGSANPEHPTHWLKQFIDRDDIPKYVQHYVIDDNPFLPKEYVERLKQEYSVSQVLYNRLILGLWCLASGRCYEALGDNPKDYIIEDINELPRFQRFVYGVDWGGNNSKNTIVVAGWSNNFNQLFILSSRRLEAKGKSPEQVYDEMEEFILKTKDKFGISAAEMRCDSAEQTLIRGLEVRCAKHHLGVIVKNALKRPINDRISLINWMIGASRIMWFKDAMTSFDAMSTCVYNTKQGHEDERLDDGTTDIDSCDATEYIVEPNIADVIRIMERTKPREIKLGLEGARI